MKHIWGSDITIGHNMLDYINNPEDRLKTKKNLIVHLKENPSN